METAGLIQTVGVLAAVIVYLTKQVVEARRSKKNGGSMTSKVDELHKWHSPVSDQETGQLVFHWYSQHQELIAILKEHIRAMEAVNHAMLELNSNLNSFKVVHEKILEREKKACSSRK
jgi:hypothetical protein